MACKLNEMSQTSKYDRKLIDANYNYEIYLQNLFCSSEMILFSLLILSWTHYFIVLYEDWCFIFRLYVCSGQYFAVLCSKWFKL